MKRLAKYCSFLFGTVMILSACEKQEISTYNDDPGIYFTTSTYAYSFTEDIGANSKTIYLPVALSGNAKDVDRHFTIEVVNDTNTNVTSEMYEIQQGDLLKNSFNGRVGIVLKRNQQVDQSLVKLKVKLSESSDFKPMLTQTVQITWTGKIIQPVNWNWLKYYFGTPFSTNWYAFMLKEAGVTSFPYSGTLSKTDPVTWWWSAAQVNAYALKVKEALIKYNLEHPGNELRYEDGPNAGQLVTMPI
ncbi:DUF4843 domain-containing protein [Solitalea koreensis]|uniref:DUF4843 domain-containing protein n=1 Tax=Solitalea koreensis TaxID=543615 RepID=A0A521AFX2_9SPHI|nr:DUF4843 domain-containing protein [Solitalea koreensis]SMO33658.1 protein of unknown function [Solitalea koreensis]